jgi:hypothetical protein
MSFWILIFLCFPLLSKQQDDDYEPCSFISGEGCMNGICKFCALCLRTYCVLATPYYTGDNEGSICKATNQDYGYDYYNYCLLSIEDEGMYHYMVYMYTHLLQIDSCGTSTQCYPYLQNSTIQHSWTNLTCDQNTCLLIMKDGSPPPIPLPLETRPSHNVSKYNIKSKSPASIALTTSCIIIAISILILIILLLRRYLNKKHSRPPSYQVVRQPVIEILPSYDQQEPSPPKYEHAIVAQIRGHHPSSNDTSTSSTTTPIVTYNQASLFHTSNDWATIRHLPTRIEHTNDDT